MDAEERIITRFTLFRNYIQNEDALVNHRTTWLIQIQAFLIATFGFSYQKKLEVYATLCHSDSAMHVWNCQSPHALQNAIGPLATEYNLFLAALSLIGLVVAIISRTSIGAAQAAVKSLESQWTESFRQEAKAANLPFITGGGHPDAAPHGFRFATYMPLFFIILWIAVLFVVLWVDIGFRE